MTTNWWWIRHGPTHEKSFVGWRDVPADLSDFSRIKRLRKILPKNPIILSSDLQRATATAIAINRYNKTILINDHKYSEIFYKSQLTLPLHTRLEKKDIDFIASKILLFFKNN